MSPLHDRLHSGASFLTNGGGDIVEVVGTHEELHEYRPNCLKPHTRLQLPSLFHRDSTQDPVPLIMFSMGLE